MAINWNRFQEILRVIAGVPKKVETDLERVNVCLVIKCPYAYKTSQASSTGCRKYSVACHCHLLRGRPELKSQATQYFLHSDRAFVNIEELKLQNDTFLLCSFDNRESLELEVSLGQKTLYAPYGNELFDLEDYVKQ